MTACYLDSAVPPLLDHLVQFGSQSSASPADSQVWESLLVNTNAGGENVHRGSLLGAALGAVSNPGEDWSDSRLVQGLYETKTLAQEIENFG